MTPFGWFFREIWEYEYGQDWALDLCRDWFEYDGKRVNFMMDLEPHIPCPCIMDQALLDMGSFPANSLRWLMIMNCHAVSFAGRYTAVLGCDRDGDASCQYYKGAQHCVMSVASS